MVKSLPIRSEVKKDETWNLQDLFTSEDSYQTALVQLEKEVDAFCTKFKGSIKDAQSAVDALKGYAQIYEQFVPIGTYASLAYSTDQTDSDAQMRSAKFG